MDLDSRTIRIIIRDKWYTLKIKHRGEYIERFKGLKWKGVHVKYYDGKLYASIVFETRYAPYFSQRHYSSRPESEAYRIIRGL